MSHLKYTATVRKEDNIRSCKKSVFFMRNHLRHHRPSPKLFNCGQSTPETFWCKDCDFETNLFAFFKNHLRNHEEDSPIEYSLRSFICQSCCFETYSTLHWLDHTHRCSREEAPEYTGGPFQTKQKVQLKSNTKTRSEKDNKTHFNNTVQKGGDLNPEIGEWFKCDKCPYKGRRKKYLQIHKKTHLNPADVVKWFDCDQCAYKAKRKSHLKSHMLKHLNLQDITWFRCDKCAYQSKRKSELKRHTIMQHSNSDNIEWFKCDKCSHKSRQKQNLKIHMQTHLNPEDVKWYRCGQCSYETRQKSHLQRHVKTHLNSELPLQRQTKAPVARTHENALESE